MIAAGMRGPNQRPPRQKTLFLLKRSKCLGKVRGYISSRESAIMPLDTSEDRRIEPRVSDATLARMKVLLGEPLESTHSLRIFYGGHLYNVNVDEHGNATIEPPDRGSASRD